MKTVVLICYLMFVQNVLAETFESLYSTGNYSKALLAIDQDANLQDKSYQKAICYSRLQEFDKAVTFFHQAVQEKSEKNDLFYEYGQALYASNELKKARTAFQTSANKKFNPSGSLYYVGHISQILEEYKVARTAYLEIIKNYPNEIKIKQVAQFQLAETLLPMLKEKNATSVSKYILPLLKEAQATDPTSAAATDIDRRYHELLVEFKLDPDLLDNGKRIPPRRWEATLGQKAKFDDNVTLSNLENNVTQTKKESFIFDTEVFYKHTFVLMKKFLIMPEIRYTFTKYSDQNNSDVFQNDTAITSLGLKNKYEHTLFARPASAILDFDYTKVVKDFNKVHKREAYSTAMSFTIGETFSYLSAGDTTIKYKRKDYQGTDTTINNFTNDFSLSQTLALRNKHLAIFMIDGTMVDNYNNSSTNTDTYLFRVDYIIPEIFPTYTADIAVAETITDTKLQKSTRGTETALNPSIDLSHDLNAKTKISVNYDFSDNKSNSTSYTYQKSVITMELKYVF